MPVLAADRWLDDREPVLAGRRLRPVVSDQQFWFALAAFLPDARIVDE